MKKFIFLLCLLINFIAISQTKILLIPVVDLYGNDDNGSVTVTNKILEILQNRNLGIVTKYEKQINNNFEILEDKDLRYLCNTTNSDITLYGLLSFTNSYNLYLKAFYSKGETKVVYVESFNIDSLDKKMSLPSEVVKLFDKDYLMNVNKYFSLSEIEGVKSVTKNTKNVNIGVIPFYNLAPELRVDEEDIINNHIKNVIKKDNQIKIKDVEINYSIQKLNINKKLLLLDEELLNIAKTTDVDIVLYGYVYKDKTELKVNIRSVYKTGKIVVEQYNVDINNLDNFLSIGSELRQKIKNEIIVTPLLLAGKYDFKESLIGKEYLNFNSNNFSEFGYSVVSKKIMINQVKDYKNISVIQKENILTIGINSTNSSYSYDIKTDKIINSLVNNKISNLLSPPVLFLNGIVVNNLSKIYYQNQKESKVLEVGKSTNFWSESKLFENKLYIPVASEILVLSKSNKDNKSIELEVDRISLQEKTKGQLFISQDNGVLYIVDSFSGTVLEYDTKANKINYTYKLEGASSIFSSPSIIDNNLIISDITENLYIIDLTKKTVKRIVTNIGCNTNIIMDSDKLFFVGNDGFFYILNKNSNVLNKIIKIDINSGSDNYLNRKILKYKDFVYFNTDQGKIFAYNIKNDFWTYINLPLVTDSNLIGTPLVFEDVIYIIDNNFFLYKIIINNKG